MDKKLKVVTSNDIASNQLSEKLELQLAEITRKKRLVDHRTLFIEKKKSLQEFKKLIIEENLTGNFESAKFKLSFSGLSSYRDEEKFNISNIELILEFIEMLSSKIDDKIINIETELTA